jgi:hypothetical protein
VVDEDPPHHPGGDSEEVARIGPRDRALTDQAHVRLVDEGGGLERVVAALGPKLGGREAAQFLVDQRHQPLERSRITGGPLFEERRNLLSGLLFHSRLGRFFGEIRPQGGDVIPAAGFGVVMSGAHISMATGGLMRRLPLALLGPLVVASSLSAATFTVTSTSDSGAGSLRQAIVDANANPGADTIAFNITGAGVSDDHAVELSGLRLDHRRSHGRRDDAARLRRHAADRRRLRQHERLRVRIQPPPPGRSWASRSAAAGTAIGAGIGRGPGPLITIKSSYLGVGPDGTTPVPNNSGSRSPT